MSSMVLSLSFGVSIVLCVVKVISEMGLVFMVVFCFLLAVYASLTDEDNAMFPLFSSSYANSLTAFLKASSLPLQCASISFIINVVFTEIPAYWTLLPKGLIIRLFYLFFKDIFGHDWTHMIYELVSSDLTRRFMLSFVFCG
ncbi:MAG: DUF2101 family protein [Nitrososphaerota archaeon]|nr:DUF2101 family protein [Nitrososphaerota archaeon]